MLLSWRIRWWNVCVWLLFMCLPYFTISLMSSNQSISSELIPTDRTGLLCCSDTVLPSHQTAGLHLHDSHLEIIHVCVCVCLCIYCMRVCCLRYLHDAFVLHLCERESEPWGVMSRRAPPSHISDMSSLSVGVWAAASQTEAPSDYPNDLSVL